jgi:phosphatidylethanolamine-binding protein (PEBP) family uncharacterized protein
MRPPAGAKIPGAMRTPTTGSPTTSAGAPISPASPASPTSPASPPSPISPTFRTPPTQRRRAGGRGARRALALAAALAVGAVLAGGCGADDRALQPPSPDQTTTTRVRATASADSVAEAQFVLTSSAFAQDGGIPDRYTCRGLGSPPPLSWDNVPGGTSEFAVVVRGTDLSRTVHWVMTGIDGRARELLEGERPLTAVELANEVNGMQGWAPPCPTTPGVHRYEFTLYAFPAPVRVPPDSTGEQAALLIEGAPRLGVTALGATVTVTV